MVKFEIRHSCQGRSGGYSDATLAHRVLYLNNFIHKSFAKDNIFGNYDKGHKKHVVDYLKSNPDDPNNN